MLFRSIIYGPIHSRRLGVSLGVNLMPVDTKLCSFNCIYCECGFNPSVTNKPVLPTADDVAVALETALQDLQTEGVSRLPDVITFSGNGEPTMHPDFLRIMTDTVQLRNLYCPTAKISVLSNSTQLFRDDVRKALMLADNRILKLDSAITETMRLIDQPVNHELTVSRIADYLKWFDGDFTLQTCFLKGEVETPQGVATVDNTTDAEVEAWLNILPILKPKNIMIYVIDRATPVKTLQKITPDKMQEIALRARTLGFDVSVSV